MTGHMSRRVAGQDVVLDQVSLAFGDGRGLADISVTVRAGERLAIIGPSGVGKTTLLRAIAGLAPVQAGRICIGGRVVTGLPPERRDAVYLHQEPVLFAHLNVSENVAFPLRVRGRRGAEVDDRVRASLEAMQLSGFQSRSTQSLSGGQRHRVALARAIAARPAALLLDEPLSALDPTLRQEVRNAIIAAQAEYGPAMIVVTHDLDDTGLLADRVAVLLDGCVAQIATPAMLFSCPASLGVARFLGFYGEVPGRVGAEGQVECALGMLSAQPQGPIRHPGERVTIVVRAEDVHVGLPVEGRAHGRVVAIRQRPRGATLLVHVDDGATGVEIEATTAVRRDTFAIGDAVGVWLDPCHALAFPL